MIDISPEAGLLGNMIVWPARTINKIRAEVSQVDFFDPFNAWVFETLLELYDRNIEIDPYVLGMEMREHEKWNGATHAEKIHKLTNCTASAESTDYFIRRLHEETTRRALLRASEEIQKASYNKGLAIDELRSISTETVRDATDKYAGATGFLDTRSEARGVLESVLSGEKPKGLIPSGIAALDRETGGLWPFLMVLAGRTGMGKSTCALNIAINNGLSGRDVTYFSLEDPAQICWMRILSRLSSVPLNLILKKKLIPERTEKLARAAELMKTLKIKIYSQGGLTSDKIVALAKQRPNTDLIVVDHLGHITEPKTKSLYESTSFSCRTMAQLSAEMEKPLLLLHQLNRGSAKDMESGSVRAPQLTDLRQSGEVEQLARIVFLLHRPAYYDESKDQNELGVNIAKNSNGRTRNVKLYCDMPTMFMGDDPDKSEEY